MVADRNDAHARAGSDPRPPHRLPPRSRSRRSRRRGAVLSGLAAAALVGLTAAPLATAAGIDPEAAMQSVLASAGLESSGPRPATAAEASPVRSVDEDEGGLLVRVSPTISTAITLGGPVALSVEIVNATGESLAPGAIRLIRANESIDEESELDEWLAAPPEGQLGLGDSVVPIGIGESRSLAAGGATVVSFTLPPELFADIADSPIIGLGAELIVGDTIVATGADAFPNGDVPASGSVAVALAAPLTVPPNAGTGLIDAAQLENWTSPTGLLTRQLDALAGRRVAIGIDPRLIASIRVLGSAAPVSTTAWLERLRNVPNEVFPLAYADADLALQAQLGLPAPLTATSFTDVLDPAAFATPPEGDDDAAAGSGTTATPGPGPEPEPTPGGLPTTEEILDWTYTRTDIAWPPDDSVAAGNLSFFDAAGLTTTLLAAGNVAPVDQPVQASSSIDGSTALVADGDLTAALRTASSAATDVEWRSATGLLLSELSLDAGEARTTVLATFARGAASQSNRVSALIDEVDASPWSSLAGLSEAIGAPPETRALADEPESEQRRAVATNLVQAEAAVAAFASVLADDSLLAGPTRRDLLWLLSADWIGDDDAWTAAASQWLLAQRDILDAVSVVPSSTINVVSTETGVPTTVQNSLSYPVTVIVDVDPSNGRLIVEDRVEVTVEPESRSTVRVPVAAGVGNGEVSLAVSLTSPTGVPIGGMVMIPANVQADWEGLGAAILAAIVVLVFGIGIWRNIRKRRRDRAERKDAAATEAQMTDAAAQTPAAGADADVEAEPADAPAPTDTTRD